jgi:hypothetical protein
VSSAPILGGILLHKPSFLYEHRRSCRLPKSTIQPVQADLLSRPRTLAISAAANTLSIGHPAGIISSDLLGATSCLADYFVELGS